MSCSTRTGLEGSLADWQPIDYRASGVVVAI